MASQSTLLLKQKPQFILRLPSSSSSTPNDQILLILHLLNSPISPSLSLSFSKSLIFSRPVCVLADHPILDSRTLPNWNVLWIAGSQHFFLLSKNYPVCLFKLKTKTKQKRNQRLSQESNCSLDSQRSRETGHFHLFPRILKNEEIPK